MMGARSLRAYAYVTMDIRLDINIVEKGFDTRKWHNTTLQMDPHQGKSKHSNVPAPLKSLHLTSQAQLQL